VGRKSRKAKKNNKQPGKAGETPKTALIPAPGHPVVAPAQQRAENVLIGLSKAIWTWPVLGVAAPLLYAVGVNAMYGGDYKIAMSLYVLAVVILGSKTIAWESGRRLGRLERVGLVAVTLLGSAVILRSSEDWIRLRQASQERSYLAYTGAITPAYTPDPFPVGVEIAMNQTYKNIGKIPAKNWGSIAMVYIRSGSDESTERTVIKEFQGILKEARRQSTPATLTMGESMFFTAFGPSLTREDLKRIMDGTETLFFLSDVEYSDPVGLHHLRKCEWLQPPSSAAITVGVWHNCDAFNDGD
jgi:hypothetical protein